MTVRAIVFNQGHWHGYEDSGSGFVKVITFFGPARWTKQNADDWQKLKEEDNATRPRNNDDNPREGKTAK